MKKCPFCNIDTKKIENTILDETQYFYIIPTLGSLVDGYILIVSKKHLNSMSNLCKEEIIEYKSIIEKYRNIFKDIYGKYPIVFEHGTPILDSDITASSVIHAHTHIVNHKYLNEEKIINDLNFEKINDLFDIINNNYILYINELGDYYITYNFKSISQIMRKLIANDLKCENKYNWKKEKFIENIKLTIKNINSRK